MNSAHTSVAPQNVSVVIVNHNAGALLIDCVRSSLAQSQQVVVVDNASADSSLTELEAAFPHEIRLQVIRTSRNLGFAAGCNLGIKAATEPVFLFLNPDCVLEDSSLARMGDVLQVSSRVGMVGGLLTNPDGTEQTGGRRVIPTPWRSFVRAFGFHRFAHYWPNLFFDFDLHKQPLPEYSIKMEAISGACMLVKREAVDDVGLWDEGYFLHCEDLDWCMRFRQKGWKIMFVPDAKVVHHKGTCSKSRPIFVEWHKHKGMMRFYRKFFRHQYPGVLMWLVAAGVWSRFAVLAVYYCMRHLVRRLGLAHG